MADNTKKSLTLPDITVSTVYLGFFSEPSDQNMIIKIQVLLSFKQFIYKHRADSLSVNFENFLRYLMLIQKIEFKIAKDKERLEVHWKNGTYCYSSVINHRLKVRLFALVTLGGAVCFWLS